MTITQRARGLARAPASPLSHPNEGRREWDETVENEEIRAAECAATRPSAYRRPETTITSAYWRCKPATCNVQVDALQDPLNRASAANWLRKFEAAGRIEETDVGMPAPRPATPASKPVECARWLALADTRRGCRRLARTVGVRAQRDASLASPR